MSDGPDRDPVKPWVSFDNYVIAEQEPFVPPPLQETRAPARASRFFVSVGIVWVLTFVLGVLTTLSFIGPDEAEVADTVDERPVAVAALPTEKVAEVDASAAPVEQETEAVVKPDPIQVSLTQLVAASLDQGVSRTRNTDLLSTVGPMSRIGPAGPTYADILRGLAAEGGHAKSDQAMLAESSSKKLRMIREGVLEGDYTVKAIKRKGKERLCLRLKNADVSREEIEMILQTAIDKGEFEVPEALRQEGGGADMDTLLFNFVQTTLANDGTAIGAEAAREMSRRAFAASNAKTKKVKGKRFYEVLPGDSLAYISLQFYGDPGAYMRIFDANRETLTSPDRIRIGQRLKIPS